MFKRLVAVELQVLISVGRLAVHTEGEAVPRPGNQSVQHGDGAVLLHFTSKLDGWVLVVEVGGENEAGISSSTSAATVKARDSKASVIPYPSNPITESSPSSSFLFSDDAILGRFIDVEDVDVGGCNSFLD